MKKKLIPTPDEFYIGYLPNAPAKTAGFIKIVIVFIGIVIILVSGILVWYQREFSNAVFEYGKLSEVKGYLGTDPVLHLKIIHTQDEFEVVLLVGFGKHGASETIKKLEEESGHSLDNKYVTLKGTLITGSGKRLLQITPEDNQTLVIEQSLFNPASFDILTNGTFRGEIVDPKCYFGVMKPGEGKPHRSCAIRCISGGIPPVFAAQTENGMEYFILTDKEGAGINQHVLDFVGEPLDLSGEVVAFDNWKILRIDINTIQHLAKRTEEIKLLALDEGMTMCE